MPALAPNTTTWGHSRPLTRCTVDSVTPGHVVGSRLGGQGAAEVGLEQLGIGLDVGHLEQGIEVVEVRRPLGARAAVEQLHGAAEADVVADGLEHLRGWTRRRRRRPAGRCRRRGRASSRTTRTSSMRSAALATSWPERHRPSHLSIQRGKPRLGRRETSTRSAGSMLPGSVAMRSHASAARSPTRLSTSGRSTDGTGTPAPTSATWGASSSELVRVSTATDAGLPGGLDGLSARRRPPRWRRRRGRGSPPSRARSSEAGRAASMVLSTRWSLYDSRWRAASTTAGGQR